MRPSLLLLGLSGLLPEALCAYTLQNRFDASNFISSFPAQAIADPTNGYANYLSTSDAQAVGLYKIVNNQVFIGVDNTTVLSSSSNGRNSVRVSSNAAYNSGLFIGDFAHIPGTVCGSWPAFWMLGSGTWPGNGEIDLLEGINNQTHNQMTIHSASGCNVTVEKTYGETGNWGSSTPCNAGAGGGYSGCTVLSTSSKTYGDGFNAAGGGIFAIHWTSTNIKGWVFPRSSGIPSDITSGGTPNPSGWGTPMASWVGCDFTSYFKSMSLLLNIDFCGSWAGAQWGNSAVCSPKASSCNAYVAANPSAFSSSYFLVNSIRVYSG